MRVGIVGHEGSKFNDITYWIADSVINNIFDKSLTKKPSIRSVGWEIDIHPTLITGACHLGGIDTLAEHIADEKGLDKIIHRPKKLKWDGGYKQRNLKIANDSDIVHVILVTSYPHDYKGMKFDGCYHCETSSHIKSGGCWTAHQAIKMGKPAIWHEINSDGEVNEYALPK